MVHRKSSPKREIHSNAGLPQEKTNKNSNKQCKLIPKELENKIKKNNEQSPRRVEERKYKYQRGNKQSRV